MSPTEIEAQAPSGTVLAFRPRPLASPPRSIPSSPAPPAPGWVPDELGMVRAVLLAGAMTAGLCGLALAPWTLAASGPGAASRAAAIAAPGPGPQRIASLRP